jgi:outer membrane protein assembly factor BamB
MSSLPHSGRPDLVYVAVKRYIIALDRHTGQLTWERRLPGLWGSLTTLLVDGEDVFAARGQRIFRIDRWTGTILWSAEISHSAAMVPLIATPGSSSTQTGTAVQHAAAAAMVASVTTTNAAVAAG